MSNGGDAPLSRVSFSVSLSLSLLPLSMTSGPLGSTAGDATPSAFYRDTKRERVTFRALSLAHILPFDVCSTATTDEHPPKAVMHATTGKDVRHTSALNKSRRDGPTTALTTRPLISLVKVHRHSHVDSSRSSRIPASQDLACTYMNGLTFPPTLQDLEVHICIQVGVPWGSSHD